MTYLTQGIILKKYHHGDFDRHYLIYTSDFGKINAIAKGAKKITSKLNSHLDYFSVCDLMLASGNNFERIACAQTNQRFPGLSQNFFKSTAAIYFGEVVDALIKFSGGDKSVFSILTNFLASLDASEDKKDGLCLLNKSSYELLKHLGYEPQIKAKNQKQLFKDLNRHILETGEKEIKSFSFMLNFLT
ncbi:MAG: DNA repair protein RecO [Patescibacteria group bacterium]|jgi:DNA repair protein RecO (recombination protein O)